MIRVLLALLMVVALCAPAFAEAGDEWDPAAEFSMDAMPAPWSYLYQEGTGVWDGTYEFDPMVIRYSNLGGRNMWASPNTSDFYGFQISVFPYYGNFTLNSNIKKNMGYADVPGLAILGFTAPSSGTYKIKGQVSSYNASCDGYAWIKTPRYGEIFRARVTGDYTVSLPQIDVNVDINAGETIYWGADIISGNSVYGVYESYPLYWKVGVAQLSEHVVPEPGALMALGSGLIGLVGFATRRRK